MKKAKSFKISKGVVVKAWRQVKANQGAAGVDIETIEDFDRNLKIISTKSGIVCHQAAIVYAP